ncbi:hypothetical protein SDC9_93891 [bioreactor metagenome]|uniref:Uncharacterized protein n=1 Tax=bioreactor metagenome TaxID=1076179 RepID=A0A645A8J5_9ZZZZ
MPPDVRLVPHAAQAQPGQLPVQRLGNADGNRGLAYAGRADKAENLPLPLRVHLAHGNRLHNPLLYLFKAEVVFIQNFSGGFHIQPLTGHGVPRHFQTHVQIIADHRALGAGIGLLAQFIHLFHQVGLRVLRQVQPENAHTVFVQLLVSVLALTQLALHHPNLGPQNLLPLGPGKLRADLVLHLALKRQHVILAGQKLVELAQADVGGSLLQNALPLLSPQLNVLCQKIRKISRVPALQHLGLHAVRHTGNLPGVLLKQHGGLAQQGLCPGTVQKRLGLLLLRQCLHISLQKRLRLPQALHPRPAATLHHHPHAPLGYAQNLRNVGYGAHPVEVLLSRHRRSDFLLRHQKNFLVRFHRPAQGRNGNGPLHVKGDVHMWENRQAPQGQNGNVPGCQLHGQVPFLLKKGRRCSRPPFYVRLAAAQDAEAGVLPAISDFSVLPLFSFTAWLARRLSCTSAGCSVPSTQARVIRTFSMVGSEGMSYIICVSMDSITARRPRAPMFRSMALSATASSAS